MDDVERSEGTKSPVALGDNGRDGPSIYMMSLFVVGVSDVW